MENLRWMKNWLQSWNLYIHIKKWIWRCENDAFVVRSWKQAGDFIMAYLHAICLLCAAQLLAAFSAHLFTTRLGNKHTRTLATLTSFLFYTPDGTFFLSKTYSATKKSIYNLRTRNRIVIQLYTSITLPQHAGVTR